MKIIFWVEYCFFGISFGANLGFRGNFCILWKYVTNPEHQHIHSLGTLGCANVSFIDIFLIVQMYKSVGKQVLLCSEYTKIFSCLLKSALRYQFSFYNNQDSWYIRIMGICLFLCLVLNGMEATYQTRTRTGPFIYSTWVHLQKAVNLAALLEELFSGQMTAKSLITFQTDLQ